jgi:hypothetical protein
VNIVLNNKDFKSSYSAYIHTIKPSQELIDSTIKLAHQHENALRKEKTNSNATTKMLSNLSFKQYSALACMMVFAIFAVKLWSGLSNDKVPTLPSESQASTTTIAEYQGSQEVTTVSDDLVYPEYTTVVSNFESNTDYLNSYTTNDYEQYIDTLTAEPNRETSVPNSDLYSQTTSETNDGGTVTTVPDGTSSHAIGTNTATSKSHFSNTSNGTTANTNSNTNTTTTKSTSSAGTTTAKPDTTATTINTTAQNNSANNTVTTTVNVDDDVLQATFTETTVAENVEETSASTPRKVRPMITTATENTAVENTWEATTKPPADNDASMGNGNGYGEEECTTTTSPTSADASNSATSGSTFYLALKVVMYQNPDGFYYAGTTYFDRIKESFSFGEYIDGIIPLDTYNTKYNGYEHLLLINIKSLSADPLVGTSDIFNEIGKCEYVYHTPTLCQFMTLPTDDLDFNGNGISATYDEEDRDTILSMISIT